MRWINTQTGKFIEVTDLPGREKPVLIYGEGNRGNHVATFRNDMSAENFKTFLSQFLKELKT